MSCPLDRCRQLSLMTSTVARNTARNNLAPLRDEVPQTPYIFIIDQGQFICAEPTNLLPQKAPAFASRRFLSRRHHGHRLTPLTSQTLSGIPSNHLKWNIVVLESRREIHLLRCP